MEILFEDIKVLLETWRLHQRDIETSNAINKIHGDFLGETILIYSLKSLKDSLT
jgi:hypothetical protein